MSFLGNLVQKAKAFDRAVWPNHRIVLTPALAAKIKERKLCIADVGSADGPEERWLSLNGFTQLITFEPNPRANISDEQDTINFPIGLWSSKQNRPLFVTAHPDSSSLCKINREVFQDFQIQDGSQVVSQVDIALDTLDSCLEKRAELSPQFLKIDVEGGDLEVMRGSEKALSTTVVGLRTEAVLLPLWEDAPQLWEVDTYLRKKGFILFNIGKVHWIRNNGLFGYTSQPQLIWGDAVYFITKQEFVNRLSRCKPNERDIFLIHFVTILLAHGCHDYAMEVSEITQKLQLVDETTIMECKKSVRLSTDTSKFILLWLLLGALFAVVIFIVFSPLKHTRNHAKFYLKQRVGRFCFSLSRWAGKAGRPYGAAIEEQYD
jgi:FkbM family methyltransferase